MQTVQKLRIVRDMLDNVEQTGMLNRLGRPHVLERAMDDLSDLPCSCHLGAAAGLDQRNVKLQVVLQHLGDESVATSNIAEGIASLQILLDFKSNNAVSMLKPKTLIFNRIAMLKTGRRVTDLLVHHVLLRLQAAALSRLYA